MEKIALKQKILYSYIKWGILYPGKEFKENFPEVNVPFNILADNKRFRVHMESHNRIAFKKWADWRKVKPGDTIILYELNPKQEYRLEHIPASPEEIQMENKEIESEDLTKVDFKRESEMRDQLIKHLNQLESGLTVYQDKETNITGREFYTEEGVGRIDILAKDKNGNFVVIECKPHQTSDKTIGQICRYMGWVKKNLAENKQVRGIIVAEQFDKAIEYARSILPNVSLRLYMVKFEFSDHKPIH
jgi:hypothetical protein